MKKRTCIEGLIISLILLLQRLNVVNSVRQICGHKEAHGAAEKKAGATRLIRPALCASCAFLWLSSQHSAAASVTTGMPVAGAVAELSATETRDLLLMREEEKLARDVYNAMAELYDQRVFINIPRAEQHHMDAMLGLLNTYGLADPIKEGAGTFGNAELQELYDELVARGATSKQDAYLVGALVEEVDIQDLLAAMERTENPEILAVYSNLLGGSKRHLNAFVRNYEAASGKTYQAQKMKQAEVDALLGR
jgi:hypothetical protein